MIKRLIKLIFWKYVNFKTRKRRASYMKKNYGHLSNEEIFSIVYKNKIWNLNSETDFNSGPGSHDKSVVKPYVSLIINFLKKDKNLVVVDLGCGDFNVGSKIFKYARKYIGIDVVKSLINHNKKNYLAKNLTFKTLDAVYDEIPIGDCIIIKEVFQHITNYEIKKIVDKIANFKYIIITDSEPLISFKPNQDKLKGPDCRTDIPSGIIIDRFPFNLKYKVKKELLRVKREDRYIVTIFYQTY